MLLLANNGRILFTFIACLRPAFPKTSLCMLRPSLAAVWGSFFCLYLCCTITSFHLRQQHKKTSPYLLSGWGAVQPNPGLIHSLTAPGGLLALQDLSCPLSVHSCHFTRTPNHFSARVGVPDSQFNAFFSPAKIVFFPPPKSLSLRLAPSSSSPDVGKFVCLCRQLAEHSLYALQGFFHLLMRSCKQSPSTPPSQACLNIK